MAAGDDAPPLLTERDELLVRDCAWAADVMRAWWAGSIGDDRVDRDEREALARQAGYAEGQEATDWDGIQLGNRRRYGVAAREYHGTWAGLKALPADAYCVLFGRAGALSAHFQRWQDPPYRGLHAVGYQPSSGWWQDPLATRAAIADGFQGELIPDTVARAFATGWSDGQVHALWSRRMEVATVTIVDRQQLEPARRFMTIPGLTKLRRFSATKELDPIPAPYTGAVDALVSISQSDGRVPHGAEGFYRLAAGGSAGYYVLAAQILVDPPGPDDCERKLEAILAVLEG